jgi:hypothetical protein
MVYDSRRQRVVLFGGTTATAPLGDTWEWDGQTWNEATPPASPPPRSAMGLAYDAQRGVVVMFGGADASGLLGDTWEWDGQTWTQQLPALSPDPRSHHTLVYDPARRRTIMIGGLIPEFWEWDGQAWSQPATPAGGSKRDRLVTYDDTHRELVFYGGAFIFTAFNDTDTASWRGGYDEVCSSGLDVDRDGAIGCADSDCAGICEPLCFTSPCAPAAPHCGDGTCSAIEDDRSCPSDCPARPSLCGDAYCAPDESATTCPLDC